jgi:hypothetical protein
VDSDRFFIGRRSISFASSGRAAGAVSGGICQPRFSYGRWTIGDCGLAQPDSAGAVSRVLNFRGTDVGRFAALPAAARDDHDSRVGDESVLLLNRSARRVSASGYSGCRFGECPPEGLQNRSHFRAGAGHAGLCGAINPRRHKDQPYRSRTSPNRWFRRQSHSSNHSDRGLVQLHKPSGRCPGSRPGLTEFTRPRHYGFFRYLKRRLGGGASETGRVLYRRM